MTCRFRFGSLIYTPFQTELESVVEIGIVGIGSVFSDNHPLVHKECFQFRHLAVAEWEAAGGIRLLDSVLAVLTTFDCSVSECFFQCRAMLFVSQFIVGECLRFLTVEGVAGGYLRQTVVVDAEGEWRSPLHGCRMPTLRSLHHRSRFC